jgi:hypothetical protein
VDVLSGPEYIAYKVATPTAALKVKLLRHGPYPMFLEEANICSVLP